MCSTILRATLAWNRAPIISSYHSLRTCMAFLGPRFPQAAQYPCSSHARWIRTRGSRLNVISCPVQKPRGARSAVGPFVEGSPWSAPVSQSQTRMSKFTSPRRTPSRDADTHFMKMAIELARESYADGEVPIGAVLVDGHGKVVGKGRNRVEKAGSVSAHAEIEALGSPQGPEMRAAGWRRLGCTLYSTIEPCAMCLSAICLARVSRVVYGAPDLRLGALGTWIDLSCVPHPFHALDEVTTGVLEEESAQLMRDFFRSRRK